jgi:hypothetical protein
MSKMPPKAAGRSDIFQTPPSAVRYITPFIPKSWRIWESARGQGQIVQVLQEDGYSVIGTDIADGFDFTDTLLPVPEFDCILTNPPYSIKDEWLQRCYGLGKPFALLLPITALGEQGRVKMYRENGIQLVLPPERINFGTPSGEGSGSWFYAAWFCHGLDLPSQISFAEAT